MSYAEKGKTFRLGPEDTMVLSYLNSCVRETITGGMVTIGIDESKVQGGTVKRTNLECPSHLLVPTSSSNTDFAGRALRGPAEAVAPVSMQANAEDGKPVATQSNSHAEKEKRRNREYDWQSYRDRYEPRYRHYRGYDWQSYRDRYEPDYRHYLDRWIPRRNRKDND
jgi:hypothetical protein